MNQKMIMEEDEIAKTLMAANLINVSTDTPLTFEGDELGPVYVNIRQLFSIPNLASQMVDQLCRNIQTKIGINNFDRIVGPTNAGSPIVEWVGSSLGKPRAFVRPLAKEHGLGQQIEGIVNEGEKILVVTDIIRTGNAAIQCYNAVTQQKKCAVKDVASIFDYNIPGTNKLLTENSLTKRSLLSLDNILTVGCNDGLILASQCNTIRQWQLDTHGWSESKKRLKLYSDDDVRKEVAKIILKIGAVSFSIEKPITFKSGILSPIYVNMRTLGSNPNEAEILYELMAYTIEKHVGRENFDRMFGTAFAGVPYATGVAKIMKVPLFYVHKDDERSDLGEDIEGTLNKGDKVLSVEDTVSTGVSSLTSTNKVRAKGALVSNCVAVYTHAFPEADTAYLANNMTLTTATNFHVLMPLANSEGYQDAKTGQWNILDEKTYKEVLLWQRDPRNWIPPSRRL